MTEFLIILLFVFTLVVFFNYYKLREKSKEITLRNSQLESDKIFLENSNSSLQNKVAALSRYDGLVDIETKANELMSNAETTISILLMEANQTLETSKKSAKEIVSNAKQAAEERGQRADAVLKSAENEANSIINNANKKAEEIAGDAYKAIQDVSGLEKTIKAMKNIVEGYGDKYLIPTYSLLDDLAEEFGYTEAGEKLKKARGLTRAMVENGTGAKCDYVEQNRRDTAIRFVLDAFNGKVDSILSKVKKDNYGTLQQMIKDAFQIVNANGKAFRNAEVTEYFLNVRLEELKWAITAQELKWQEQEEQRKIKEQLREEEKARREFEKAIRDAQKEEELLKKLIEKAQKEVSKANDEQRIKFEEQLNSLQLKLKEAEEKNQRALSMAQQTKSGNVYIISNIGSFGENVYKIGMTRRLEPLDRIRELGDASVPFEFDVHSMIFSENAPALERELHKKFLKLQMNKVNPRKEFFKVTLEEIKEEIEKLGINPKWTITAAARHYRESLALEEAMKVDKRLQEEWMQSQLAIDSVAIDEIEEAEVP